MTKHAPNYKPKKITAADKRKKANQKKKMEKMASMSFAGKLGNPVMRVPLNIKTGKPTRSNFNTKIKL